MATHDDLRELSAEDRVDVYKQVLETVTENHKTEDGLEVYAEVMAAISDSLDPRVVDKELCKEAKMNAQALCDSVGSSPNPEIREEAVNEFKQAVAEKIAAKQDAENELSAGDQEPKRPGLR